VETSIWYGTERELKIEGSCVTLVVMEDAELLKIQQEIGQ
jgi:hypothetical protein